MPIPESLFSEISPEKSVGSLTNYSVIREAYIQTERCSPPLPDSVGSVSIFYFVANDGTLVGEKPLVILMPPHSVDGTLTDYEKKILQDYYHTPDAEASLFSAIAVRHIYTLYTGKAPTPVNRNDDKLEMRFLRDYLYPENDVFTHKGLIVSSDTGSVEAAMRGKCAVVQKIPYHEDMSESSVSPGSKMDEFLTLVRDYACATDPDDPKKNQNLFTPKGEYTLMFLLGNFGNPNFIAANEYTIAAVRINGPTADAHCFTEEEIHAAEEYYYAHNPYHGSEPNRETAILYGIFGVAFCKFSRDAAPNFVSDPLMAATDILPATNVLLSRLITKTNVVAVLMVVRPDSSVGAVGHIRLYEHDNSPGRLVAH